MPLAERRAHQHTQDGSNLPHGHALGQALFLWKKRSVLWRLASDVALRDLAAGAAADRGPGVSAKTGAGKHRSLSDIQSLRERV